MCATREKYLSQGVYVNLFDMRLLGNIREFIYRYTWIFFPLFSCLCMLFILVFTSLCFSFYLSLYMFERSATACRFSVTPLLRISALLLRQLKAQAAEYLGQEVHHAVITVPAFFNDAMSNTAILGDRNTGGTVDCGLDSCTKRNRCFILTRDV